MEFSSLTLSLHQDRSTVAQRTEVTVAERSLTSYGRLQPKAIEFEENLVCLRSVLF